MSIRSWSIITLFVVLALAAVIVMDSEDSDAATDYTIKGYVGTMGDAGMIPLEGIDVEILLNPTDSTPIGHGVTNSAGSFEFQTSTDDPSNLYLRIVEEGYSIHNMHPYMNDTVVDNVYALNLTGYIDGNICTLCTDLAHCIVLTNTKVPITIQVTGKDSKLLVGATVTVYHEGSKKYTGETDSNGVCEIDSKLSIGDYEIEVVCPGYEKNRENITISLSSTTFFMSLQEKEISTYGGMTVYHIMMVVGVFIGFILAISGYILCRHNWKHVDG